MNSRAVLAGRILLVALFVFSGVTKLADPTGTAAHIQAKGLPAPAVLALAAAIVEIVGGLMIMLGWKTRPATVMLIVFIALATVIFHDFWNVAGREQINQMLHAFKNVSMIGGLLILFCAGPGRLSIGGGDPRWKSGGLGSPPGTCPHTPQ
jgi:putative oxidoreductase